MGERRKRKSLWDREAEVKPSTETSENHTSVGKDKQHPSQDGEHNHEFYASESQFGQRSLESIQEEHVSQMNGKGRENAFEGKERGGENSYYQNMSPELKYNHSIENDRSSSRRYTGRGRSRSRSRSRIRSRSRSRTRGRERERVRSRSRSRSPLGDYKHQSSGWRSLPDKSTEVCTDFASGRCRRGSQCKYLHPKDTDTSESRRSRFPRTESRGDVSDPHQGEDGQFQNNSKDATICRNFIKGKCRWGDSCRFSHHDEASVDGAKRSSPDKDAENQPYRSRNSICKYFAAGKCDRDNCRFSHEDSKFSSVERRQEKVASDRSSREKGNKRNGLRWDDSGRISDDMKPSNRNNSSVFTETVNSIEGYNNRISHSLGNENIYDGVVENNQVSSFHSEVIHEAEDSRNATDPVFLSGQILHRNGENLLPGLPSVYMVDSNLQSQIQKLQNAIQMTGMPETNASLLFPNSETTELTTQYTPMANPVMCPNQRFENEETGEKAVAEVSNSTGMVLSMTNASGHVPLHSMKNGRSGGENENRKVEGQKMPKTADSGPNNSEMEHSGRLKVELETAAEIPEFDERKGGIGEESKGVQESKQTETVDEKGMRLFKNALIEFVKEILKPTWKEGRMSREVHKTIVKKVVDKITSAIQTEHIPKTQEKVEQYLSFSKPKIAKLVQAYVDRCLKTDS